MGRFASMRLSKGRVRSAVSLTFAFVMAMAFATSPITASVFAAPATQVGPTETFTGTVVPGTETMKGGVTRYSLERPAMSNAQQLEQIVVETSGNPSIIRPYEILQVTGNYDVAAKTFRTTAISSLGTIKPGGVDCCDNDNSGNGNDNSSNDNGSNGNDN